MAVHLRLTSGSVLNSSEAQSENTNVRIQTMLETVNP